MKAVVLHEIGGPEKLHVQEFHDPKPLPGEVLVRLRAAALNRRDVWIRTGKYAGIKLPIIPGSDGAGKVVAVGDGMDQSLVGIDVVINPSLEWGDNEQVQGPQFKILGLPDNGTYAEFVTVAATQVFPKPDGLSFEEAAAIPLAGLTAYRTVVTRAKVKHGETVLVTGIGGGVSIFALQFLKKIGATVFVTSGSNEKIDRACQLGADGGANYKTHDWMKEILNLTGGTGPDVAIDSVGGETLDKVVDLMKPGGRIVIYGATTGPVKELQVRRIFWKQLTVLGSTMGTAAEFSQMIKLFGDGGLYPILDKVLPLSHAADAHRRMESNEQFGKIVLKIE
jgi:zinc-binding alcohol dehydrogenase/oxidoreductase